MYAYSVYSELWRDMCGKIPGDCLVSQPSMNDELPKEVDSILWARPMAGLWILHAWAHKGTHIKNSKKPVAEAVTKY